MVEAAVLLCVLDGHHVLYVLNHADDALHTFGAGADGTQFFIADTMADTAIVDVCGEAADGLGELQHLFGRLLEQMQSKAQSRALPHARQGGEGFDSLRQSVRGQLHAFCDVFGFAKIQKKYE